MIILCPCGEQNREAKYAVEQSDGKLLGPRQSSRTTDGMKGMNRRRHAHKTHTRIVLYTMINLNILYMHCSIRLKGGNISSTNYTHFNAHCVIKPAILQTMLLHILVLPITLMTPNAAPSIQSQAEKNRPPDTMTGRATFVTTYLEDVLRVVHAVDPNVVLQRGAVRVGEEHQPQALGSTHVQGLSHQRKGAQLLREKSARLGLKLAVIGLRHQLFPHQQDILEEARRGGKKTRCEWKVKHPIYVGGKGNGFA